MASIARPTMFVADPKDGLSQLVLRELRDWITGEPKFKALVEAMGSPHFFSGGVFEGLAPEVTVLLFDARRYLAGFCFHDFAHSDAYRPPWAGYIRWGVEIGGRSVRARLNSSQGPHSVAHQIAGAFCKNFERQVAAGERPWGPKRGGNKATSRT